MSKSQSRIGDVFESQFEGKYRYFQFAGLDLTQLNSDVIAVFEGVYNTSQSVEMAAGRPVEFFTHTTVSVGVPEYWHKVGSATAVDISTTLFKDVNGDREDRQPFEGASDHWNVWNPGKDFRYVGGYENVPEGAELGLVFSPDSAYFRLFHDEYDFTNGYFGVKK